MEMTEDEIVKKYLNEPTNSNITLIADLNGTQPYVIKTLLEKKGVLQKVEKTKSEPTKNDKNKKTDNKKPSVPVETENKPEVKCYPVELIPAAVKSLTEAKIRENRAKIVYHCEEIDKLNDENNELTAFLKGELYGNKDRIHWEVENQQV